MNPLIVQAVLYGAKVARKNIPTLTKGMSRLVFDFVKDSSDKRSNSGKQIALSKKSRYRRKRLERSEKILGEANC